MKGTTIKIKKNVYIYVQFQVRNLSKYFKNNCLNIITQLNSKLMGLFVLRTILSEWKYAEPKKFNINV